MSRSLGFAVSAALLISAATLLSACGGGGGAGPGVASVGSQNLVPSGPSAGSGSQPSGQHSQVAYVRCMRSHGIHDFPDPSNGGIQLQGQPGSDLDPNNPRFMSAQQACQSLLPSPSAAQPHQDLVGALKFAQCMRAHGIHMPDPNGETGNQVGPSTATGSGGNAPPFDPNSPQFKTAQQACQQYAPSGGFVASTKGHP
jgi:hypothetical protein